MQCHCQRSRHFCSRECERLPETVSGSEVESLITHRGLAVVGRTCLVPWLDFFLLQPVEGSGRGGAALYRISLVTESKQLLCSPDSCSRVHASRVFGTRGKGEPWSAVIDVLLGCPESIN